MEILHEGDEAGEGLVRTCIFEVPKYLLSGGKGGRSRPSRRQRSTSCHGMWPSARRYGRAPRAITNSTNSPTAQRC
ncbi:hypothetical protein BZL30_4829 [Mycobacterium kansasii]|uniref:Uncharacterized protein n=1 Tax=Mycobacterium kansasii TaxID=1768 RepID=A0A1V3X2V8_MYCKA|nr:hypothetical protein BZL30_4829 [Mycobacterium kansasii]